MIVFKTLSRLKFENDDSMMVHGDESTRRGRKACKLERFKNRIDMQHSLHIYIYISLYIDTVGKSIDIDKVIVSSCCMQTHSCDFAAQCLFLLVSSFMKGLDRYFVFSLCDTM
jgi:hypothetical protein